MKLTIFALIGLILAGCVNPDSKPRHYSANSGSGFPQPDGSYASEEAK